MVINYKPLNQYLVPRKIPIPLKDDLLRRIPNATTFSKLDLKSGFWRSSPREIPMDLHALWPQNFPFWLSIAGG